jgi:hypothetical protein
MVAQDGKAMVLVDDNTRKNGAERVRIPPAFCIKAPL